MVNEGLSLSLLPSAPGAPSGQSNTVVGSWANAATHPNASTPNAKLLKQESLIVIQYLGKQFDSGARIL